MSRRLRRSRSWKTHRETTTCDSARAFFDRASTTAFNISNLRSNLRRLTPRDGTCFHTGHKRLLSTRRWASRCSRRPASASTASTQRHRLPRPELLALSTQGAEHARRERGQGRDGRARRRARAGQRNTASGDDSLVDLLERGRYSPTLQIYLRTSSASWTKARSRRRASITGRPRCSYWRRRCDPGSCTPPDARLASRCAPSRRLRGRISSRSCRRRRRRSSPRARTSRHRGIRRTARKTCYRPPCRED